MAAESAPDLAKTKSRAATMLSQTEAELNKFLDDDLQDILTPVLAKCHLGSTTATLPPQPPPAAAATDAGPRYEGATKETAPSVVVKRKKQESDEGGFPTDPKAYALTKTPIGKGAFANVHMARCTATGQDIAIKIMDLEQVTVNLDHLRQEVTTMKLCQHPNVLPLYNCFTVDSHLWLVMPYMNMGSCLEVLRQLKAKGCRSELDEDVIAAILSGSVKGLAYLHKSGWIHRDIKAGNILLDSEGNVMLADFGVAGFVKTPDPSDPERMRNTFVGTPCWMAPEVMKHTKGYTEKADIWSLGITALELAKSYAPYAKEKTMRVLLRTLQEDPPSLDTYESYGDTGKRTKDFSKQFNAFYKRMLAKNPDDRPTAKDLAKDRFITRCKNPKKVLMEKLLNKLEPLRPYKAVQVTLSAVSGTGQKEAEAKTHHIDTSLLMGWVDPAKSGSDAKFTMAQKIMAEEEAGNAPVKEKNDMFKDAFNEA